MGRTHHDNATFNGRPESCVSGTVFEVTDAELDAADRYEQAADYIRIAVTFASGQQGWVYVHAPSAPDRVLTTKDTKRHEGLRSGRGIARR